MVEAADRTKAWPGAGGEGGEGRTELEMGEEMVGQGWLRARFMEKIQSLESKTSG